MERANKKVAIARAIETRLRYNLGTKSNIDIFDKFKNEPNFTLVFMPFDNSIDGFSHKRNEHYIIVINSNNNNNRNNFTCAHELYHLLYEYNGNDYVPQSNSEEMANIFASYFLVPEDALYLYLQEKGLIKKGKLSLKDIVNIEDYFQVSRNAILIRLKDENLISQSEYDTYSKNVLLGVKRCGGKIENHLEHEKPLKCTQGEYMELAKKLLDSKKISEGKYEEYIIDAFNSNLLYNNSEGDWWQ